VKLTHLADGNALNNVILLSPITYC